MPESIEDALASFLREMRSADKAPNTLRLYSEAPRGFAAWLTEQGRPATVDQLTRDQLAEWFASMSEAGNAAGTVATRFKCMRRFVRWCANDADIAVPVNPMSGLEVPQVQPRLEAMLTDDQVVAMLKATAGKDFMSRRDHAILRVLFDCGIRLGELIGITTEDVDFDLEAIYIIGKGRKPRGVPFGAKTARALDRYDRVRRSHKHAQDVRPVPKDDPRHGKPAFWLSWRGPYSARGVGARLDRIAQDAGISKTHPHAFRHRFAHEWMADGGSPQDLKRLAGWSSDAMLEVYGRTAADARAHAAHRQRRIGDRL